MALNPLDLMKQAKQIKEKMDELEASLASIEATGESGGGIVRVTLNGKFECVELRLDPIAVDPRDVPMLEVLIKSAHAVATEKIRTLIKSHAQSSGLGNLAGLFS